MLIWPCSSPFSASSAMCEVLCSPSTLSIADTPHSFERSASFSARSSASALESRSTSRRLFSLSADMLASSPAPAGAPPPPLSTLSRMTARFVLSAKGDRRSGVTGASICASRFAARRADLSARPAASGRISAGDAKQFSSRKSSAITGISCRCCFLLSEKDGRAPDPAPDPAPFAAPSEPLAPAPRGAADAGGVVSRRKPKSKLDSHASAPSPGPPRGGPCPSPGPACGGGDATASMAAILAGATEKGRARRSGGRTAAIAAVAGREIPLRPKGGPRTAAAPGRTPSATFSR